MRLLDLKDRIDKCESVREILYLIEKHNLDVLNDIKYITTLSEIKEVVISKL